MEITWTEPDVKCELVVRWWSAMENSMGSRSATLVDLKRANEAAGLPSGYVDRDEAFESEQKLKVRIAVLEAEHAAYLDARARAEKAEDSLAAAQRRIAGLEVSNRDLSASLGAMTAERDRLRDDYSDAQDRIRKRLDVRIAELEAQIRAAKDTSIAERAMDKFYAEGIDPRGVLHGIDLAIERAKKAEAERDLAKHDFELANEAYDELHARFDELASSPERIALLEALEPHDPNAARASAAMDRERAATRAVLGARDGEDLISAAKRAVSLADLYRAHYRRAVIGNFTADRAMTEGLAECDRLRARIAELEASVAERESLREAVWEFERLLRERVGGGGKV